MIQLTHQWLTTSLCSDCYYQCKFTACRCQHNLITVHNNTELSRHKKAHNGIIWPKFTLIFGGPKSSIYYKFGVDSSFTDHLRSLVKYCINKLSFLQAFTGQRQSNC